MDVTIIDDYAQLNQKPAGSLGGPKETADLLEQSGSLTHSVSPETKLENGSGTDITAVKPTDDELETDKPAVASGDTVEQTIIENRNPVGTIEKAKAAKKTKRFLSGAQSTEIINMRNNNFAVKCLKICGLKVDDTAETNRAEILEFVQSIKEGTSRAPKPFISLMVSQLSNCGVESELKRMKISSNSSVCYN